MNAIIRATRSSAAHLATAQRHAGNAARQRSEAQRLMVALTTPGRVTDPTVRGSLLARLRQVEEAETRAMRLQARAMVRHEAARAMAHDWPTTLLG